MAGLFKNKLSADQGLQVEDMKAYYAFQAKIYDLTRWSFLFGRDRIIKQLPLLKQGECLERERRECREPAQKANHHERVQMGHAALI